MKQHMRKLGLWVLALVWCSSLFSTLPLTTRVASAADNGLASRPYMGWSSYSLQVYDGPAGNWTSEAKIKEMSDAMHEKLQSHGYDRINIDAGWNGGMDGYGRPLPNEQLYPGGFQNLIDYIHGNGQKIGLYFIPGLSKEAYDKNLPIYGTQCHMQDIAAKPLRTADYWNIGYKIDFSTPCAQAYIDSIADELGSWGIDFVKFDSVTPGSGHNDTTIDARDDVAAWSKALSRHHIWFELSWALDHAYVDYWKKYANGWRVDWDVEAYNPDVGMTQWANIARLFPDAALWWRDAGPGGWNDFDSLNIGNGLTSGLTRDERQTAMTLWAVSSAQLYTGDDLSHLDDYGLQLLTNDEVIAVNQAGHPAHPLSTQTNTQLWYSNNNDGTYTVALFNLGTKAANMNIKWQDIGLDGSASIRDLWSHKNLGTFEDGYGSVYLEPHASRLFKVTAKNGTSSVNDDDTGVRYSGDWKRNGGRELVRDAQDLKVKVIDSTLPGSRATGASDPQPAPTVVQAVYANAAATVSHSVYINDNDPTIVYANPNGGSWGYSSGRPDSFNDFNQDIHYGENDGRDGPEFTYSFFGTGIEMLSEGDAHSGDFDLFLDGTFQMTASAYDPALANRGQYSIYRLSGLPNGVHTLRGVAKAKTDEKWFMDVDAFKVTADSLLGITEASFDKSNPGDVQIPLTLGTGSLLSIHDGLKMLQAGTDYVSDGRNVIIKKDYLLARPEGGTTLSFGFAGGDHQALAMTVKGAGEPEPSGRGTMVNNDDPGIVYMGAWSRNSGRNFGDYKDDVHFSETNGDSFQYSFKGTGIRYITEIDPSEGKADIYLDGEFVKTIDMHADQRQPQQVVFEARGLTNGQHSLRAVKRSGQFMLVDALYVEVPDLITPSAATFDRNPERRADLTIHPVEAVGNLEGITNGGQSLRAGIDYVLSGGDVIIKKEYLGTLPLGESSLTFRFKGDYGDDVHATGTNGDSYTFTFTGTGIELFTPKGPDQGEMDVYLDGKWKATVDAHADARSVQQSVFAVSGLSKGTHTIKVVKKSGRVMLTDRIDFDISDGKHGNPGGPHHPH